jgi:hypothetical protein
MADTGERREITRFANAKETETVQVSKKLISKTKQGSAATAQESRSRKRRNVSPVSGAKSRETENHKADREGTERMVDEGDPNPNPRT